MSLSNKELYKILTPLLETLNILTVIIIFQSFSQVCLALSNESLEAMKIERRTRTFEVTKQIEIENAEDYNALGIAALEEDNLDAATVAFQRATQLAPDNAGYYTSLGTTLYQQGELDEAVSALLEAVTLTPNADFLYALIGYVPSQRKLEKFGDFNWIDYCQRVVQLADEQGLSEQELEEPRQWCENGSRAGIDTSSYVYKFLGDSFRQHGELERTITSYQKAIWFERLYSFSPVPRLEFLGALYQELEEVHKKQGSLEEAEAARLKAEQMRLGSTCGYLPRGISNEELGATTLSEPTINALEQSIDICRDAIQLDPSEANLYPLLGVLLDYLRQSEEAIAAYQHAVHLDPNNARFYEYLGSALQKQGKLDEALTLYQEAVQRKAVRRNFENRTGYLELLNNVYQLSLLPEHTLADTTISFYHQIIQLDVNDALAYFYLGRTLHRQGIVWQSIGNIVEAEQRLNESRAAYQEAMQLDRETATQLAAENIEISPRILHLRKEAAFLLSCEDYTTLGKDLEAQGNLTEAVAAYQIAVSLRSGSRCW